LVGCASLPFKSAKKTVIEDLESEKFKVEHTSFLVMDLGKNEVVINKNGSKYFIPASTTKLFSFYSSLKLLEDTLPALKYSIDGNQITAMGTGDPTWLHPYFKNEKPIEFLKQYDSIYLYLNNYEGEKLGPGWAWEDYPYYFSPEMNAMPLYGNVVTIEANDTLNVSPIQFLPNINIKSNMPPREWKENLFYINTEIKDTLEIPYMTSNQLTQRLLSGEVQKEIQLLDSFPQKKWNTLPGIARDSVLKRMLWESDNFLAEQLMVLCSSTLSDTLSFERTKDFILNNYFASLKQEPRWVDGSGLSRYNLFTPESMVQLLQKLHAETDSLRLLALMPRWNANGTITEEEKARENAFIYAKSGSMGNVYNLCGYLRTKSGKLLAFSFMNNHFRRQSYEVRKDMYDMLSAIHYSY
jgi:D-alanyl-D-alanine carboxypeptidase/D-alanyl-D-alanine-endopeptidase (penicillin-binding protein 4)